MTFGPYSYLLASSGGSQPQAEGQGGFFSQIASGFGATAKAILESSGEALSEAIAGKVSEKFQKQQGPVLPPTITSDTANAGGEMSKYLPWILGGIGLISILVLMKRRR